MKGNVEMENKNKNRIQIYLNETYQNVLNEIKELKQFDSTMDERELIKYIVLDYQQQLKDTQELQDKLKYMDKNLSIVLNLVASMATEYHIQPSPLEESLPYFQSKRYVESLMNLPRSIKPSPSIQQELQEPTKRFDESALMKEKSESEVKTAPASTLDYSVDDTSTQDDYDPYATDDESEMPNYFL